MKPGTIVGAGRWPEPLHSSLPPWKGVVLAIDDPLAWRGSIAFGDNPQPEKVGEHVRKCQDQGLIKNCVPVLWDFGHESRVYWERADRLRPYEVDVALWRASLPQEKMAA